jgi:hypothetical protein
MRAISMDDLIDRPESDSGSRQRLHFREFDDFPTVPLAGIVAPYCGDTRLRQTRNEWAGILGGIERFESHINTP